MSLAAPLKAPAGGGGAGDAPADPADRVAPEGCTWSGKRQTRELARGMEARQSRGAASVAATAAQPKSSPPPAKASLRGALSLAAQRPFEDGVGGGEIDEKIDERTFMTGGGGEIEADGEESRGAVLEDIGGMVRERQQRVQDLEAYMNNLSLARNSEGGSLVDFGSGFPSLVDSMLDAALEKEARAAKAEGGWSAGREGPGESDERHPLDIPEDVELDPEVRKGFRRIVRLDRKLEEETARALRMSEALDPEKAAARKAARLEAATQRAQERIETERRRRQQKERLAKVLQGEEADERIRRVLAAEHAPGQGFSSLTEEEEAELAEFLGRAESGEGDESTPFDVDLGGVYAVVESTAVPSERRMAEIDAQLAKYTWNGGGYGNREASPARKAPETPDAASPVSPLPSTTAFEGVDYLREYREMKFLAQRAEELDAALRACRTSEIVRASEAQINSLVEECRQRQAVWEGEGDAGPRGGALEPSAA